MEPTIQRDGRIQHVGWPTGIVGGLLLISLGLELLAQQTFGQTDVGTLLWALYVGFWTFILGTTGFLLLAARWVIEWRHLRAGPAAMNQLSSVESKSSHSEKSELDAISPIRQQSMTSVIHGRPSLEGHDRNEVGDRTKVA